MSTNAFAEKATARPVISARSARESIPRAGVGGQLATCTAVPSAISAKTASGFEFSPQISPETRPNSVS